MRIGNTSAALLAGLVAMGAAQAATLYEGEGGTLGFKADGMAGAFSTSEDYLGEGGKDWREGFIHGVLTGTARLGEGEAHGGLGAIDRLRCRSLRVEGFPGLFRAGARDLYRDRLGVGCAADVSIRITPRL